MDLVLMFIYPLLYCCFRRLGMRCTECHVMIAVLTLTQTSQSQQIGAIFSAQHDKM